MPAAAFGCDPGCLAPVVALQAIVVKQVVLPQLLAKWLALQPRPSAQHLALG